MPSKGKTGESAPLPSTLERSPVKAQETYEQTLEAAEKQYDGDEAAAHRVAWGAVKHSFEKIGDHWEPKDERGPSDSRAEIGGPGHSGKSHGGVDVEGKTKDELLAQARDIGAHATTHMTKDEIGDAIDRANQRADREARTRD